MKKTLCQLLLVITLIIGSFGMAGKVEALSGCGTTYTVQWGDTLSGIAVKCGTTMYAIRQANPGLGYWVYAGQVLYLSGDNWGTGGSYTYYTVVPGDTLKNIAIRFGTTMDALASLNGIYNYNFIYVGQVLKIPSGSYVVPPPPAPYVPPVPPQNGTYVVQPGDTLRILAIRWGVTVWDILAVNPQITNASLIYVGQVIYIPGAIYAASPASPVVAPSNPGNPGYYTVQVGDTLRIIANMYGTTVYNLQSLNPQIYNPNWIYPGMSIRVQ